MLYRFKSRATADFVMLDAHARPLFDLIGKAPSPEGIVTVDQIPAAISALEAAMASEGDDHAVEDEETGAAVEHIGLRQRASPLLHMLKDSLAEGKDVTWGT